MWNIEAITGYKPKTTFWDDFTIAERFGLTAIHNTFRRSFGEWNTDYIYLTELVMVLNWKVWEWYERDTNSPVATLYQALWEKADAYAGQNLKGEELDYFYLTTD